ncbi:MAG TPA: hypothetical protein VJ124_05305 [Pyrinomonadaceae bacterium]|nr:hypothetical protein [Pyrinomonadaceae bacterium]
MKLTFQERVALLELVPAQEDYAGLKEIRRLRETCAISGEEAKKYGEKSPDGTWRIDFNKTAGVTKEVPIGEWMTEKIRDILRKKDEKHQLEEKLLSLFEKFIVNFQQY